MRADHPLSALALALGLALRNLARQRVRTGMTLGAIAIGVAALIVTGGFVQDIFVQLGEALIHSQSGHLQVAARGFFAEGTRTPERFLIREPGPLRDRIATIPGVQETMPRLDFSGLLNNGRSDLAIIGQGVDPEKEARLGTSMRLLAGRALAADDRHGIVVGAGVAQALKLAIGDRVVLVANTPQGALNTVDFDLVGVFQTFSKDFDDRAVRVPIETAQELLDTPGASMIVLALARTDDTARVAAALQAWLPDAGLEQRTWVELNDFYDKAVALYERQFGVLQLIVLLMVVLSVANSVNMTLFERAAEFGTLRALGNRDAAVRRLILLEALALGILGSLAGVALGIAAATAISAIGIEMPPPPNSNVGYAAYIQIVPTIVLASFAIGTASTLLAALLPANRISRMDIVDALRRTV